MKSRAYSVDIRKLRNQQSLPLARSVVYLLNDFVESSHEKNSTSLLQKLNNLKDVFFSEIKTEPLMKNNVSFIFNGIKKSMSATDIKSTVSHRAKLVLSYLKKVHRYIAEYGYKKIKRGMCIFTYNYSESVMALLFKAKKEGTNFEVHIAEARPTLNGKKMATELAKQNIPVIYYPDAAIRIALKKSDLVLLGADTISGEGQIYCATGSELISEIAERYSVPVYICMPALKFNPSVLRDYADLNFESVNELWHNAPKGVIVANYLYEKVHPRLITGIITELGIYKPHYLISEIKKRYDWI